MGYYTSNGGLIGPGLVASATGVHNLDLVRLNISSSPYPFITAGNKTPTLGVGGASWPPAGWTELQNVSADDSAVTVNHTINFTIDSGNYAKTYVGSNSYLTWSASSTQYSGLAANSPAVPKLFVAAKDNSFQRVASLSNSNHVRIRYEGSSSTSGTPGSPNIVWEANFFEKANYSNYMVLELLIGSQISGGVSGIANASTYYDTFTASQETSIVFIGNSTGTAWTAYPGYYVNNSGF